MNEHKYMWNHAGTALLISIWSDSSVQKRLLSTLRNQPIWDGVARYMAKKGFHVNGKQCRTRIKNILVRYREVKKTGNFNGSGIEPFFYDVDRVMKTRSSQSIPETSMRGAANTDPLGIADQKNTYRHSNEFDNEIEQVNIKSEQNSPPIGSDDSVQELHELSQDSTNEQNFFESIDVGLEDDQSSSSLHMTSSTARHSPLLVLQSDGRSASTTGNSSSHEGPVNIEQEMGQTLGHLVSNSHIGENTKLMGEPMRRNSSLRLERLVMRTIRAQNNSVTKILNAQNEMFMKLMEADRAWQKRVELKLDKLLERVDKIVPNKEHGQDMRLNCLMDRLDWALPPRQLEIRNRSQETKIDSLLDKLDRLIPALHSQQNAMDKMSV